MRRLPSRRADDCHRRLTSGFTRDYGVDGQIGLGADARRSYVAALCGGVRVSAAGTGVTMVTYWINLGDYSGGGAVGRLQSKHSYWRRRQIQNWIKVRGNARNCANAPPDDILLRTCSASLGVPRSRPRRRVVLRSDIIWRNPNLMPESVTDRPTKARTSTSSCFVLVAALLIRRERYQRTRNFRNWI